MSIPLRLTGAAFAPSARCATKFCSETPVSADGKVFFGSSGPGHGGAPTGAIRIEAPRDRDGRFAPLLVPRHARRFTGFDDKIIKTRGHFPNGEAASKPIWLALRNIAADWKRPGPGREAAMNPFARRPAERFAGRRG
jgi:transposase-like protein